MYKASKRMYYQLQDEKKKKDEVFYSRTRHTERENDLKIKRRGREKEKEIIQSQVYCVIVVDKIYFH